MNCKSFLIKDQKQISDIVEIIHDCWFDVSDILFDPEKSVLSVKFKREAMGKSRIIERRWIFKKWEIPLVECFLNFYHVTDYSVKDRAHIGTYVFTDLEYDAQLKRIVINTVATLDVTVSVEELEISVEETDNIIKTRTITTLFDLRHADATRLDF